MNSSEHVTTYQGMLIRVPPDGMRGHTSQRVELDDAREAAMLFASIAGEAPPTIGTLTSYRPRIWGKEEINIFLQRRKDEYNRDINNLNEAFAKALRRLEIQQCAETEDNMDKEYYEALEELKAQELVHVHRRFGRLREAIDESYLSDVRPKHAMLWKLDPRVPAAPSTPPPEPPVIAMKTVPTNKKDFEQLPQAAQIELAELLSNHVGNKMTQADVNRSRYFKGHAVTDFARLRLSYKQDRDFRSMLARLYRQTHQ